MAGYVGVAPGTTTVQLPDGRVVQFTDWIDDKHYGSAEWNTGDVTALEVFSQGKSQQITGGTRPSTRVDTNIPRQGDAGLPKDWEFLVYGFGFEFIRAARATTNPTLTSFSDPIRFTTFFQINRRIANQYVYNGKQYTQGLIVDYPQGHGPAVFTTQTSTEIVNNGVPSPRDRLAMVLPVHERELLGYAMQITPVTALVIAQPASDAGENCTFVDLRVLKTGLIKRTVV